MRLKISGSHSSTSMLAEAEFGVHGRQRRAGGQLRLWRFRGQFFEQRWTIHIVVADDAPIVNDVADPLAGCGVNIVSFVADEADVVAAPVEDIPVEDRRVPFAARVVDEEWLFGSIVNAS